MNWTLDSRDTPHGGKCSGNSPIETISAPKEAFLQFNGVWIYFLGGWSGCSLAMILKLDAQAQGKAHQIPGQFVSKLVASLSY